MNSNPWVLLGDFNVSLNFEDSTRGNECLSSGMLEFWECVEKTEVEDINKAGLHFTWNQRPNSTLGILKKTR